MKDTLTTVMASGLTSMDWLPASVLRRLPSSVVVKLNVPFVTVHMTEDKTHINTINKILPMYFYIRVYVCSG